MERQRIAEGALIDVINAVLADGGSVKERSCRVESLQKTQNNTCNWVVSVLSISGPDLSHATDCSHRISRVVAQMAAKYDVPWPE